MVHGPAHRERDGHDGISSSDKRRDADRGKVMLKDYHFRIRSRQPQVPTGGTLNPISWEIVLPTSWQVSVEQNSGHFIVKAGCQTTVVHNYKEARKWLIALADKEIQAAFKVK